MVSFVLSKKREKDVFLHVTSIGQRKKSESSWGIKPQTFRFCADAQTLSHSDSMLSVTYDKVYMTCVLHTAGIINVDSIMSVFSTKRHFS